MANKKTVRAGIIALSGAVILGASAFLSTHVLVDGEFFSKKETVFDLTDHNLSAEEYQSLVQRFPENEILWTIPFQGARYAVDTESLTVTSLTEAEADLLDYLPNLKQVDAEQCSDYSALAYLQGKRPDCQVLYSVPIGNTACSSTAQELTVTDADISELQEKLAFLPQLRALTLEGALPEVDALQQLRTAYPNVALGFTATIGGQQVSSDAEVLDLTGSSATAQELTRLLPLFSSLKELTVRDTGLTDSELKDLITQFPEIFFLCDLDFAGMPVATDSVVIDISNCSITVEETEAMIPYFPKLEKLIMSFCGIDDETMDALNQRYPEISIVWSMEVGLVTVRTDDTTFFPARVNEIFLPSNEELQKLRYCTDLIAIDIGHSKATDCEWARYLPNLRYLIIADTQITDLSPLSNAKELIYLEAFDIDITDYTPLLGCTSLQDLNIGTTYADPEPLTQMTWLHNLQWHGILKNPELKDKALALQEQLSDTNVTLQTRRKNIGGTWRYLPHYYVFRELLHADYFNQETAGGQWGTADAKKLLATDHGNETFAGDVLAEIVRYRIDNSLPISGIKNVGSEKAEVLYQSLVESRTWYQQ